MWPEMPPDSWDCHIHSFDPERHPFKLGRTYTPPPASLASFFQQSPASRVILVQATVEDGHAGLMDNLTQFREQYPDLTIRGTIAQQSNWDELDTEIFDTLHELGVRSIRVHGFYGGSGGDPTAICRTLRSLAASYPVRTYGWSISAQLPLKTWANLSEILIKDPDFSRLHLIADHNACAAPADLGGADLRTFLELLRSRRVHVKVSALYRRSPKDIQSMRGIIERFAEVASDALLWGSDWPHCDTTAGGDSLPPLRGPQEVATELQLLRDWLTEGQWRKMLCENPQRAFA
jgi:predicted TIM-barrel fold metal-dependent hydrolase